MGSAFVLSILAIAKILNTNAEPNFVPARTGEVRHSCADVSLFAQKANFHVLTELSEGLKITVDAWQQKIREYSGIL